VTIGLVGKYTEYEDSYKSPSRRPLLHGGLAHGLKVVSTGSRPKAVMGEAWERQLEDYDGILVPGVRQAWHRRMLNAIRYARESKTPYFGICLGMPDHGDGIRPPRVRVGRRPIPRSLTRRRPTRVFQACARLKGIDGTGGTIAWALAVPPGEGSLAQRAYGCAEIEERHRHRYESPRIRERLKAAGPAHHGEIRTRPTWKSASWAITPGSWGAVHPEFKSKPMGPHPLFKAFIGRPTSSGASG